MESKIKVVLVVGPPGVGKGTQSKLLAQKSNKLHISTGDFIRDSIKNGTALGKMASSYVKNRLLVPDDLINQAIVKLLKEQAGVNQGVVLDGFPRTLGQALTMKTEFDIEKVIYLKGADDICLKRILNRQADESVKREVDDENQIQARLDFFNDRIQEICDFFKEEIQIVDGTQSLEEVSTAIEKLFPKEDKNKAQQINNEESCVVCMGKPADHLVTPCGHQCGCESCLMEIFKRLGGCPICRQVITGVIRVYRAGVAEEENKENVEKPSNPKNNKNEQIIKEEKAQEIDIDLANNLNISVAPCEEIVPHKTSHVGVTFKVPDTPVRRPIDVCCVIDISGSMADHAKYQDPEDETKMKTDGMSVLDLVKHAVKTVINTLTEQDRLSIIAFDTHARTTYPLTEMTEKGRTQGVLALEELVPEESTNIWEGLKTGLESLRTAKNAMPLIARKQFLYLLTDGQPNVSPPNGEAGELKQYFESHPNFECQVNVFGFGYNLKSSLLLEICLVGGGVFSFIPDAKIVGTNFVNAIANAATTLTQNATVHLVAKGASTFAGEVEGNMPFTKSKNGKELTVKLGNLQYGKDRDIVVPMTISKAQTPYLEVTLEFTSHDQKKPHKISYLASSHQPTDDSIAAHVRNLVVSESYHVIKEYSAGQGVKANKRMNDLAKKVSDYDTAAENNNDRLRGLVSDIVGNGDRGGRMTKAITTNERFNRWGQHYLSSITRAHQLQLRTNFIDIGLQVYGGETFCQLQDLGGKIFLALPMTIKEVKSYANQNSNNNNNMQPAKVVNPPVNNEDYYGGGGGGCFDGSCWVTVLSNSREMVRTNLFDVRKNDFVKVVNKDGKQSFTQVLCVVRILLEKPQKLIEFNDTGLKITKNHPVWFNNQWRSPISIQKTQKDLVHFTSELASIVFNFVLSDSHILLVNNIPCVTMGHEIKEAFHPFYGTSVSIDTLRTIEGFAEGFVHVHGSLRNLRKGINEIGGQQKIEN